MSQYFFTGGQMPSDDLLLYFHGTLQNRDHWCVSGTHYQKDLRGLAKKYGRAQGRDPTAYRGDLRRSEMPKWWNYWRIFFMACAELWGYRGGDEWHVSHYRFSNSKH